MKRFYYSSTVVFLFLIVFSVHSDALGNTCPKNRDAEAFWDMNASADGWCPKGDSFSGNARVFLKESSLGIELRNIWQETGIDSGYGSGHKNEEWAQVGTVRFSSGMFMGIAGIDAVGFGVLPLRDEENNPYSVFFDDGKDGFQKGGISLKISPFKGLLLKAGRMESPHILLGPGDFRTTPRMYELGMARYSRGPVSLSFMKATGASDYTNQGYSDFAVNEGSWRSPRMKDRPVELADIRIEHGPYMFNAAYARQKDDSNYTFVEASVTWPVTGDFSVRTDLSYRRKDSEKKNHKSLDHVLSMWSGRVVLDYKRARLNLAYSAVENNTEFGQSIDGTMGVDWMVDGTTMAGCKDGGYYTNGVQGLFSHQGENAFKIEPEYRFGGSLEGLSISAYYIKGWNLYAGSEWSNNQRQHEYGGHLRYRPEYLKGLAVEIKHGKNTMKSDGEYGMDQEMERTQIEVKYTALIF